MAKTVLAIASLALIFSLVALMFYFNPIIEGVWLEGWNYRTEITINSDLIDEELNNFTVLVFLNSSRINWAHVDDYHFDIRFTDLNSNLLNFEIEFDWITNNMTWFWVQIPFISNITDTSFYVYYGNPDITEFETDFEVTWDNSFMMVNHMVDSTQTMCYDSTYNYNDGIKKDVNEPIEDIGKISKAQSFDGVNDYINCGHDASLNVLDEITIIVWLKFLSVSTGAIVAKSTYHHSYELTYDKSNDKFCFDCRNPDIQTFYSNLVNLVAEQWYHVVATVKSGEGKIYVNLDAKTTAIDAMHRDSYPLYDLFIGERSDNTDQIHAVIDEVRIYNRTLTNDEIKANYYSEIDGLLSFGNEEEYEGI